jgi:hypothetical protein
MANLEHEGFDSKMLYLSVTDLSQTLKYIEGETIDADLTSIMISSITIKKRSGINLTRYVSLVIIDMPSFKKEANAIASVYESDDEVFIVSDLKDLDKIPERKSTVKRSSSKSIQLGRDNSRPKLSIHDKELSVELSSDNSLSSDILK